MTHNTVFHMLIVMPGPCYYGCRKKARGRAPLKAQPVITEGLMGMVSAAELLWIVFFLAMCLWIMANYLVPDFKRAETEKLKPYESV